MSGLQIAAEPTRHVLIDGLATGQDGRAGLILQAQHPLDQLGDGALGSGDLLGIEPQIELDVGPGEEQDGRGADAKSLVTIFVSTGPDTATVPDVTGESQAQATADLQNAGFGVDVKQEPAQRDKDIGKVISQNPAPNAKVTKGSTVTITVGAQP